jgi:hypothetical protein
MLPGSSGASAPMGVQFCVRAVDTDWAIAEEGGTKEKRSAMLFASWGWREVRVALSRKAPTEASKVCVRMAVWRAVARFVYVSARVLVVELLAVAIVSFSHIAN